MPKSFIESRQAAEKDSYPSFGSIALLQRTGYARLRSACSKLSDGGLFLFIDFRALNGIDPATEECKMGTVYI